MADSTLDLALIEFNVLQQVAKDARIPGWDDLSRADLVFALRKQGQGASAPARGAPSETGMVPIVSELLDVVRALSNEISQLRNVIETSKSSQENFEAQLSRLREEMGELKSQQVRAPGLPLTTRYQPNTYAATLSRASTTEPNVQVGPNMYTSTIPGASSTEPIVQVGSQYAPPAPKHGTRMTSSGTPGDTDRNGWQYPPHRHMARAPALQRSITSQYKKPMSSKRGSLQGAERIKRKCFYLGNVDPGCEADSIREWCKKKAVDVLSCSISESKYFGTAYAHLVVPAEHTDQVLEEDFWPSKVSIREWRFASDSTTLDQSASN